MENSSELSANPITPVAPEELRVIMRNWTTGVTIVSSRWKDEQNGMTVSSFTSISLDPPLVSISLAGDTRTHRLVANSGVFAVMILAEDQQELSDRFAGRIADTQDRFVDLETFSLVTGSPCLGGGLAYLDCQVVSTLQAGKNTVFLGEVIAVSQGRDEAPLLYFDRNYQKLCDE
jgi:flavin reductase (DIM6/NTAB) family NADH-FMN oxidoreductase RutF